MPDQEPPQGPTEVVWPIHSVSGRGTEASNCWPTGARARHFAETNQLPTGWRYRPCPHYPHLENR